MICWKSVMAICFYTANENYTCFKVAGNSGWSGVASALVPNFWTKMPSAGYPGYLKKGLPPFCKLSSKPDTWWSMSDFYYRSLQKSMSQIFMLLLLSWSLFPELACFAKTEKTRKQNSHFLKISFMTCKISVSIMVHAEFPGFLV